MTVSTWLPDVDADFDSVFGLRPDLYAAYREFADVFYTHNLLDPLVLDLCRQRVEALLRGAPRASATDLTDAQRACVTLAEQFVLDPHGVTPQQRTAVTEHFGEAGLVALVEALAVFDGFTRFRSILEITDS